jgi:hypothetical protein
MVDDSYHMDYIRKVIDKTFCDADKQQMRPMNFRHTIILYCLGYLQACVNFGILSPEKYKEFVAYIEAKKL